MARDSTVEGGGWLGTRPSGAPSSGGLTPLIADGLLALVMTGVALVSIMRPAEPINISVAALACVGALSLAGRRISPMGVLLVCTASFCLYQALGYPHAHPGLPFPVLIALYTVAARSGALIGAAACSAVMAGFIGSEVMRRGGPPENLDDELLAYALAIGAACALGYAVQLSRARTDLLREQAALLASKHAAHEQRAIQKEQARIARDLHDMVAHQITVITALAAGADRIFNAEPERAQQALNSIEGAGREALTEMRRLLRVLRATTDENGLITRPGLAQLPALVAQTERADLPVQLSVRGQPRSLPAGVEVCAYLIVQEALTNTLKHAGPSRASVLLSYLPASLELQVRDDGRGMPSNFRAGQGLIGMRERADLLGGRLIVDTGPSGGVHVTAWLPLDAVQP